MIELRRATAADSDFIAWVILAASRGHLQRGWFDISLERPEQFCLAYIRHLALVDIPLWSWRNFRIAEVGGERIAGLCSYGTGSGLGDIEGAMRAASRKMGISDAEHREIIRRGNFVFDCVSADDSLWTIDHGATIETARQLGAFHTLARHALDLGRVAGAPGAQISYLIGNEAIERACVQEGFVVAEERCTEEFAAAMGSPGFRRVVRDL